MIPPRVEVALQAIRFLHSVAASPFPYPSRDWMKEEHLLYVASIETVRLYVLGDILTAEALMFPPIRKDDGDAGSPACLGPTR